MERGRKVRNFAMLIAAAGSLAAVGARLLERGSAPRDTTEYMAVATIQGSNGEEDCSITPGHPANMAAYQWCYDAINHLPLRTPVPSSEISRYATGDETSPQTKIGDESNGDAGNGNVNFGSQLTAIPTAEMHKSLFKFIPVEGPPLG